MALFCFPAPSLFYLMKYLFVVISMQLYVPDRCSAEYLLFKHCFVLFLFILGSDCSRASRATHTHSFANTWTHSCSHCSPLAASIIAGSLMCVCVCEWQRRVSDERGELIVMLCWIQMRERQAEFWSGCLLSFFRSPSLSISQSENT